MKPWLVGNYVGCVASSMWHQCGNGMLDLCWWTSVRRSCLKGMSHRGQRRARLLLYIIWVNNPPPKKNPVGNTNMFVWPPNNVKKKSKRIFTVTKWSRSYFDIFVVCGTNKWLLNLLGLFSWTQCLILAGIKERHKIFFFNRHLQPPSELPIDLRLTQTNYWQWNENIFQANQVKWDVFPTAQRLKYPQYLLCVCSGVTVTNNSLSLSHIIRALSKPRFLWW